MALILADRVKESTTTTGTSDFALGGAMTGFQTFASAVGANNTTYYAVADGADWEVGLGTLSSNGLTLARTTVLQSSNSDTKVSFASGTKHLFVTYPADKAVSDITSTDASIVVSRTGSIIDLAVSEASPASTLLTAVRNTTGATLTKGTAVYISGATGQKSIVSKALATGDATSAQTLGLITSDLANNSNGYVTVIGLLSNIDTSAYADGAQLFLSPTTAGTLTATKPYAPQHLVYVAIVEYAHPTQGKLFVKVQNGYEMDELHNVSAQSPTTGQTLVYNSSTSLWEKNTVSLTVGVNGTLPIANGGSGTTTAQGAINAFAGAVTSGSYLRGNGTDVIMSAIQAADVPTLNQNTTGSAATLATGRTISITGDLAYTSPSFNGSTNVTASGTLATVNTNVGSFTNASFTVNAKGLITAASSGTAPVTSVTGTSPVNSSGGATPAISLASGYGDTLNPYASKTANYVLASPDGSSGVPTFRAIVSSDIPTLNQNTTGTAANITATSNSTLTTLSALSLPYSQLSGTVPTWNQNTTGTASNVTGTVAIANGGTGETTRQNAMDALAGAVTSGQYLRGNGTDVVMSAIQVADVPTLNQNTTGTASNVTGVVAVANGGTGTATPSLIAGTNVTISGSFPNQTINASGGGGSGTVTSVAATVPSFLSVSGSPITTSGTLAFSLASTPTNGQLLIGNGTGFSYSTLTAGSNITITNSSGGITIASTGGGGGGSSSPIPKLQSWSIGAM